MQKIKFKAKCPYEIGDKIQFEKRNDRGRNNKVV